VRRLLLALIRSRYGAGKYPRRGIQGTAKAKANFTASMQCRAAAVGLGFIKVEADAQRRRAGIVAVLEAGTISWVRNCTFWKRGTGRSLPLALSKEGKPMKPLMPAALLIALSTVALAKPTPIELPTALVDAGVMNMDSGGSVQENTGSIGAMREREYFQAPQSPLKTFPCRIEPVQFDKMRMAQSCR
jgi:hypothetical protein